MDIPNVGITTFELVIPEADQTIDLKPKLVHEAAAAGAKETRIKASLGSTDKITAAGKEKLRAAGFAPPAPRSAGKLDLVQLQRGFRCPYCGSTDTALENIFGPTPCRSIRYCNACRQPFEQFKTI